jgi:regulator of sirC expression with transglutaminase-like and TPR domain
MQDIERLCVVKRQLYTYDRYMGNYQNQDDPENNYINSVLDRHRGNPLSLSALYYLICHKLEIELQVVNFRVYYALRYIDKTQHFYVDAYNNGLFFTPQQVQQFLQKHFNETNVFNYKPLSNIYIILNFIRLLAANYKAAGDTYKASIFEKLEQDIDIKLD